MGLYGAWIGKDGKFIPVSFESHQEVAQVWLWDNFGETLSYWKDIYNRMFSLGFARVVFNCDNPDVIETIELDGKFRKAHRSYIKRAKYPEIHES